MIRKDSKITGKKKKGWYFKLYMTIGNTVVEDTHTCGGKRELTNIMIWREVSLLTRSNVGRSEDLKPCVQLRVKILFPGQPCHC